ncbi:inverted formin-2-like [Asterias rubens]|uniref:inverted formin-2-like n=1 Tax=Asterias rubens TaxID=7604 RepID=UPI00145504AF|nr:inverted formin-2-like [Asterias rubens]
MCESLPTSPNLYRKRQTEFESALAPHLRQRSGSVHKRWTRLLQQARRQNYKEARCGRADDDTEAIGGAPPVKSDEPEHYVNLLHSGSGAPSAQSFSRLKKKLTQCDSQWMLNFLELNGLGILFEALTSLSQPSTASIARAYAQVEVVESLKAVMNSPEGLDFIIDDQDFPRKLATALGTDNVTVKKQVFEILSALCTYNGDGYNRAIDALEHYKTCHNAFAVAMVHRDDTE